MGGKAKRLSRPMTAPPADDRFDVHAREAFAADMRRIAREQGVCRTPTMLGEVWVTAQQAAKYKWRYKAEVVRPGTTEVLLLIRESTHPTMIDIAVSVYLRTAAVIEAETAAAAAKEEVSDAAG